MFFTVNMWTKSNQKSRVKHSPIPPKEIIGLAFAYT